MRQSYDKMQNPATRPAPTHRNLGHLPGRMTAICNVKNAKNVNVTEKRNYFRAKAIFFAENIAESPKRPYLCTVLIQQLIVLHLKFTTKK